MTTLRPGAEATVDEPGAPPVRVGAPGTGAAAAPGGAPGTGAAAAPKGPPGTGPAAERPARRRRPHHTIARVLWSGPRRLYEFYWGEGIADDVPALAYYLVLSLAPFALGLAALEALLLKDVVSAIAVADQLNRFLPEAVHGDIRRLVLGTRDNSPLLLALALFAMLWTSSGGIGVIERCLSRILDVPRHNIVIGRIRNLGLGALVAVAVILASLSTSVVTNLSYELRPGRGFPGPMILVFNGLGSMLVFATIYRYGPLTRMRWRSALLGAVPGGLAIQAVPAVVGLYVSAAAGFAAVQLFLLLAIMLLGLYIVALLLLVGAGIAGRAERRAWER
ncbi:MAG: rane protein [Solirubrobacteraceae bacterium]|nr:rane protein [Solirubrobacteraceae bacterium]